MANLIISSDLSSNNALAEMLVEASFARRLCPLMFRDIGVKLGNILKGNVSQFA